MLFLMLLSFCYCCDYDSPETDITSKHYLNTLGGIGGHEMTLYKGCNYGDFFISNNGLCVVNVGNMTVNYLSTRCLMSLNYGDGDDIFCYSLKILITN